MEKTMTAVELTGTVDENRHLQLDDELPFSGPVRVRVLILSPMSEDSDETTWLYSASHNPAFAYLNDAEEDLYSLDDGAPFQDEV